MELVPFTAAHTPTLRRALAAFRRRASVDGALSGATVTLVDDDATPRGLACFAIMPELSTLWLYSVYVERPEDGEAMYRLLARRARSYGASKIAGRTPRKGWARRVAAWGGTVGAEDPKMYTIEVPC